MSRTPKTEIRELTTEDWRPTSRVASLAPASESPKVSSR